MNKTKTGEPQLYSGKNICIYWFIWRIRRIICRFKCQVAYSHIVGYCFWIKVISFGWCVYIWNTQNTHRDDTNTNSQLRGLQYHRWWWNERNLVVFPINSMCFPWNLMQLLWNNWEQTLYAFTRLFLINRTSEFSTTPPE